MQGVQLSIPCSQNAFLELYELFKFMQSKGKVMAVIDADNLTANPEKVMKHYCTATGLPYDTKMPSWTPGVVEDWRCTHTTENGIGMPCLALGSTQTSKDHPPKVITFLLWRSRFRKKCLKGYLLTQNNNKLK